MGPQLAMGLFGSFVHIHSSYGKAFGFTALLANNCFPPAQISFVLKLAEFTLTHNYFKFLDKFYLQTHGTAMGANFAPSFAKLFIGSGRSLELAIWSNNPFSKQLVYFSRYIDDIFIIWHGDRTTVEDLMEYCNENLLHNGSGPKFYGLSGPGVIA